jgi:ATP-dependent exoDNAse (exonuclease V) beta subunit
MNLNKFTIQTNFAISAGASSGKTYTPSRRYINACRALTTIGEKLIQKTSVNILKNDLGDQYE